MKYILLIALLLITACKKDDEDPAPAPAPSPTTPAQIGTPTLVLPVNGIMGLWPPISFSWNEAANAPRYEIRAWYVTMQGTNAPVSIGPYTYDPSITLTSNLGSGFHGRTIYWYVRGANSNLSEFGPWSDVRSFILQ